MTRKVRLSSILVALTLLAACSDTAASDRAGMTRVTADATARPADKTDAPEATEGGPANGTDELTGQGYPPAGLPRAESVVSWQTFSTFDEVVREADLFVVGEIVAVEPGREVAETPTQSLPFTNSVIRVTDVAKGKLSSTGLITVEQPGGIYRPTHAIEDAKLPPAPLPSDAPSGASPLDPVVPPDELLLEVRDDPLFKVGENVALALVWKPKLGVYQIVNPQARFDVQTDATVQPILSDDPATKDLRGLRLDEFLRRVAAVGA